jgi:hypothetical protein
MVNVAQQYNRWDSQESNLPCFDEYGDYGDLGWELCCSVSFTTVGHWHSGGGLKLKSLSFIDTSHFDPAHPLSTVPYSYIALHALP